MRTVCGLARRAETLLRRARPAAAPMPAVRPLAGGRSPLLGGRLGEQRRGGVRLDQVDGTTCGSAVLVALAAWADPAETLRLDGERPAGLLPGNGGGSAAREPAASISIGFGARYDARQRQVHKESTRFWPQAIGTSPWGMVAWLRKHAPGAGPYRVRLVDDRSAADVADALLAAGIALAAGRPVPMLIGPVLPRHYVMALGTDADGWRVYEPTSGEVRNLDLERVRTSTLAPVLGFDRLHALLLPA
ncbi:hypothetical protein [Pseudonocardia sp. GCM10023141]|uniref:hypothetical protein n=1 Tax=Pseudonocardia sp. GCM10023141 TaxID=3252653 RepID=UPI003611BC66